MAAHEEMGAMMGRERLDEHVRQATRLAGAKAAMLVDPVTRRTLWDEITRMRAEDLPAAARTSFRRLHVAAVVVVVVVVVAFVSATVLAS